MHVQDLHCVESCEGLLRDGLWLGKGAGGAADVIEESPTRSSVVTTNEIEEAWSELDLPSFRLGDGIECDGG